jgi:hypothetical protein
MISAQLNGGLGNCMFQIAATYALAKENGDKCAFNFSAVPKNQGNPVATYRNNIFKKLIDLPNNWVPKAIYKELCLDYTPIKYCEGMLLKGYFQREEYFAKYKDEIGQLFRDENLISDLRNKLQGCLSSSVSIHVRRGDYIKFSSVHPIQDKSYYDAALQYVEKTHDIKNILVFSDDIPWCKNNFHDSRVTFVNLPDYEDLYLMGLCDANIISNSSFSWWGSWLGAGEQKLIIAPRYWMVNVSSKNIIPSSWIII